MAELIPVVTSHGQGQDSRILFECGHSTSPVWESPAQIFPVNAVVLVTKSTASGMDTLCTLDSKLQGF